jgi:hypothetical protein
MYIENVPDNRIVSFLAPIEILGNNFLRARMLKDYYDYHTAQWQSLEIEIVYEKDNL